MQEQANQPEREDRRDAKKDVDLFDPWRDAFLKDMKRNNREFEF